MTRAAFRNGLRVLVRSPWTQLFIGVVYVIAAVIEAEGEIISHLRNGNVKSEHGAILFGLFVILQSVQQLLSGLAYFDRD